MNVALNRLGLADPDAIEYRKTPGLSS